MGKSAEEKFWEALRRLAERQEQNEKAIEKLRERQEKTDEQLRETNEELRRIQKETHEEFKRMIREIHRSDEKLKERVEEVSDGYGRFVEGIMAPSAYTTFTKMGFKIKKESHREKVYENKKVYAELDTEFIAEYKGEKYIIIGEAKTYFTQKLLRKFFDKIKKLKAHEDYKDEKLIFFVAAVHYDKDITEELQKNGIYTFYVSDDVMELKVPKDFKPKEY